METSLINDGVYVNTIVVKGDLIGEYVGFYTANVTELQISHSLEIKKNTFLDASKNKHLYITGYINTSSRKMQNNCYNGNAGVRIGKAIEGIFININIFNIIRIYN
jgi:hypothetical protein